MLIFVKVTIQKWNPYKLDNKKPEIIIILPRTKMGPLIIKAEKITPKTISRMLVINNAR
ncbi:unnamed protein product [marine sediment metagenome]|uniref:Uncharacterized protein n=1 Tax=marine sediment metagenome TaxID=412755 RepID=X1CPI8_9ZZZZ